MSDATSTIRFVIEDDFHAEPMGDPLGSLGDAIAELRRLANLPSDEPPNRAPCVGWDACGRDYWIIEYDVVPAPWRGLRRLFVMRVGIKGANWVVPADEIATRFAALTPDE